MPAAHGRLFGGGPWGYWRVAMWMLKLSTPGATDMKSHFCCLCLALLHHVYLQEPRVLFVKTRLLTQFLQWTGAVKNFPMGLFGQEIRPNSFGLK